MFPGKLREAMKDLIVAGLILIMASAAIEAKTTVKGELRNNTTWTAVVVKFHDGNDDLIVEGTLIADGGIPHLLHLVQRRFRGGDTDGASATPGPDQWGDIVFRKGSG